MPFTDVESMYCLSVVFCPAILSARGFVPARVVLVGDRRLGYHSTAGVV